MILKSIQYRLARIRELRDIIKWAMTIGLDRVRGIVKIENDYGHMLSWKKQLPLDKNGEPLPWYTYPAIDYLRQIDFREKNVFEYGSGMGSLFWASRARTVESVESNADWFREIENKKMPNQTVYHYVTETEYVDSVRKSGKFYDVIIIDGNISRLECAKAAVQTLAPDGMIILDNSDWFNKTTQYLRDCDLMQVDFTGMGPLLYFTWTTSIYFRRSYKIKPLFNNLPLCGLCSRKAENIIE